MNREKIRQMFLKNIEIKSWKVRFNELDSIYTDKILDYICDFERFKEHLLYDYYLKLYQLKDDIEKEKSFNEMLPEELSNSLSKFKSRFDSIMEEFLDNKHILVDKLEELFFKTYGAIDEIKQYFHKVVNLKDTIYFQKRFNAFIAKIKAMLQSFNITTYFDTELLESIVAIFNDKVSSVDIQHYAHVLLTSETSNSHRHISYHKIFNPKDMIKLAAEHEYEVARQSGDHIIMIHKTTKKIVPIPYHDLGYGLMIQIQKQIHQNKFI